MVWRSYQSALYDGGRNSLCHYPDFTNINDHRPDHEKIIRRLRVRSISPLVKNVDAWEENFIGRVININVVLRKLNWKFRTKCCIKLILSTRFYRTPWWHGVAALGRRTFSNLVSDQFQSKKLEYPLSWNGWTIWSLQLKVKLLSVPGITPLRPLISDNL